MSTGEFPNALHNAAAAMHAAYEVRFARTTPRQAAEAMSDFVGVPSAVNEIAKALAQRAELLDRRSTTDSQREAAAELVRHCYHLIRRSADTYRALNGVIDAAWAVEAEFRGINIEL